MPSHPGTFPCCKIEIYNTAGTLIRTLNKEDLLECNVKDMVTSGVGSFNFTVPALLDFTPINNNIGNNYTVKIFFGYDNAPEHLFSGRILPFTTTIGDNALRMYEGKALGEILERRFKTNKRWQAVEADDIAAEVASDLGLTGNLDTDTTAETQTVRTESYLSLMQKISDYWISAGSKLQKDFYVDKDNVLQWHDRPLRTGANVETLVYGEDFQNYSLKYDILAIKNRITVYGAAKAALPQLKDDWTDTLTGWTTLSGSLALNPATPKAGTNWINCTAVTPTATTDFYRTIPRVHLRDINQLNFWHRLGCDTSTDVATVRLHAPDTANAFTSKDGALNKTNGDHWNQLSLGESAEYDVLENPSGTWERYGSPNWMDINAVEFVFHATAGFSAISASIDKMYFYPDRYMGTQEDSTSQTNYGAREAEYTDDNLLSTAECQTRAETLLYQLKDRVLRLDFAVNGNTNIWVGDRIPLSLPPDDISAVDFDVVSLEHSWAFPGSFRTVVHAVQGADTRQLPAMTPLDATQRQLQQTREVTAELYSRVVR